MSDACSSLTNRRDASGDKEATLNDKDSDRPCESIDSSDCSNHSTTTSTTDKSDKDTEQSSDSESKNPVVRLPPKPGGFTLRPALFGAPVVPPPVINTTITTSCRSVLRPSALADQASKLNTYSNQPNSQLNKSGFNLKPPVLANPFLKDSEDSEGKQESNGTAENEQSTANFNGASSFVFGQNLHERVANVDSASEENVETETESKTSKTDSRTETEASQNKELSLSESAEEYEAARQIKRKYEEVEVKTGEENESNVLQINCKLFAFDKPTASWQERGRGLLRLNDMSCKYEPLHSRVVVRTTGNLRVVLNTMVWSGMTIEKVSDKSIRLTAIDNDQVKVFLVMTSPKDADTLYSALDCRLSKVKNQEAESNPIKKLCATTTHR